MDVAGFAGFADDTRTHALADAAEMMVDGADSEQGRDCQILGIDSLIAENEDPCPLVDSLFGSFAEFLNRSGEPCGAGGNLPEGGKGSGFVLATDLADGLQLFVEEDRRVERDLRGMLRGLGEEIAPPPQCGEKRHDQTFTDRINRRVSDLGKKLAEIGVKQTRTQGEDRERCVVTHGADGFRSILEHRLKDHVELFACVAEGDLALGQVDDVEIALGGLELFGFERSDTDAMIVHHLAIVMTGCEVLLDLRVAHQDSGCRVDGDHLSGGEATFLNDRILVEAVDSHLGAETEDAAVGDLITGRTQSIAIKAGADRDAIGEDEGGRSVPWLAEAGVVLVKGGELGRDLLVTTPGWGHQHGHGMQ